MTRKQSPSPEAELKRAEFKRQVVALRRQSLHFRDIAEQLGCSVSTAHTAWKEALAEVPAADVAEARESELTLVLDAIAALMVIAEDPTATHRARIDAWVAVRGWSEHRARLQGSNAPIRTMSLSQDAIDHKIEELEHQLALNDPA